MKLNLSIYQTIMTIVIFVSIITFFGSIIATWRSKNRIKIFAIMIPLWTTISVVIYQLYSKITIIQTQNNIIAFLTNSEKTQESNPEILYKMSRTIEEFMNNDFKTSLDFMISLFGIVLSVWVGLTIYNAVKKDELDKLISDVDKSNKLNTDVHVSNLYKAFDKEGISAEYYSQRFFQMDKSELEHDIIACILVIENSFHRIVRYYENNQYQDILRNVEHGIELCNSLENILSNKKTNSIIEGYCYQRKGDFLYYKGMGEKYTSKRAKDSFVSSLNSYIKTLEKDIQANYLGYMDNTIRYLYFLIAEYEKDKNNSLCLAKENLLNACNNENFLYYKNLGAVYEKLDEKDNAEKCYKKAVAINPRDYKSQLCLASFIIKKVQSKLNIRQDILLSNQNPVIDSECQALIEDANNALNLIEKLSPSTIDSYYKRGQLLTYRYLLEKNNKKFVDEAKKCFSIAKSLNTTFTANKFHERNFYEAQGDIQKAIEINESLIPEGDSEYKKQLYLSNI